MTRRALWLRAIQAGAVTAALVLGNASHAQAQNGAADEEEGLVFGARQRLPLVDFSRIHGNLDLLGQYTRNSAKVNGARNRSSETHFEETLTLRNSAYLIHPNFLTLDMSGTLGLQQNFFESSSDSPGASISRSSDSHSTLYAWDVSGRFIQNTTTPLTLYTNRTVTLLNRSFGPSINSTNTSYGAQLSIQSQVLPTHFHLYRNQTEQTSLGQQSDFSLNETAFEWFSQARPTEHQSLSWNYRFRTVEQSLADQGSSSETSHQAVLSHTLNFGRNQRSNLTSTLDYREQSGIFDIQHFRWDERLRLWHNENFETSYTYNLNQQSSAALDQTFHRATAGFRHRLYDSLTTTGRVGYKLLELSGDGGSQEYSTNLDFDYRKKVPYGRLLSGLGLSYHLEENKTRDRLLLVRDLPVTFFDAVPLILSQPGILLSSIELTDQLGRIFSPITDFEVSRAGGAVQIDRIVGGAIEPGTPLLLDYNLAPQVAHTIATNTFSVRARYNIEQGWLRGVGVYGRYFNQDQSFDVSSPRLVPNDVQDVVYGVDYRIWDALLSAERQIHDSTIAPYERTRLRATLAKRLGGNLRLNLNAEYTSTDYGDTDNQVDYLLTAGRLEYRITPELSLLGSAAWRHEDSTQSGTSTGFEQALEVRWQRRQFMVFGRVRNVTLESSQQETDFQLFQFGLRREF